MEVFVFSGLDLVSTFSILYRLEACRLLDKWGSFRSGSDLQYLRRAHA